MSKKKLTILSVLEKDKECIGKDIFGVPIIGGDELLKSKYKKCAVVNTVFQSTQHHESIIKRIKNEYNITNLPNLIHPKTDITFSEIGIGNIIYENVLFGSNVKIGNFNNIFYGSILGHDVTISNSCLLGAGVVIGARSNVGDRVYISNSSTINIETKIVNDCFIGVGSVVTQSILKPKKVFGNPAKEMRF